MLAMISLYVIVAFCSVIALQLVGSIDKTSSANNPDVFRYPWLNRGLLFRLLANGPNSLQFARLHYDREVHRPYLGFRETANLTSEEVLNLVIIESEMTEVGKE